jgi:hypothetical protein
MVLDEQKTQQFLQYRQASATHAAAHIQEKQVA